MSLEVEGLAVTAATAEGPLTLLSDVALTLPVGGALGVVGESGSGKTLLALAIIGLLPDGLAARGTVRLDGVDLLALPEETLCQIRGARIGMIFQEPLSALNPAMTVGRQIAEGLRRHKGLDRAAARAEVLRLLDRVHIPGAARRIDSYPHELSGGQRQRVGIAIALAPGPDLLIADEPTTALDVTVQAEILDLLGELVGERGMSLIVISHDLGVIASLSDRVLVMYAGTRVEEGSTKAVLRAPLHPYTKALLAAVPRRGARGGARLATIPGTVPAAGRLPPGCRFAPRCPEAIEACRGREPGWDRSPPGRAVRCIGAGPAS
ncbi:MAG: ABC transporter ATP-binding protein [Dongiaceae bacterium]